MERRVHELMQRTKAGIVGGAAGAPEPVRGRGARGEEVEDGDARFLLFGRN